MIVIKKGHTSVVDVLLQAKADIKITYSDGESVSSLIAKSKYKPILVPMFKDHDIHSITVKV